MRRAIRMKSDMHVCYRTDCHWLPVYTVYIMVRLHVIGCSDICSVETPPTSRQSSLPTMPRTRSISGSTNSFAVPQNSWSKLCSRIRGHSISLLRKRQASHSPPWLGASRILSAIAERRRYRQEYYRVGERGRFFDLPAPSPGDKLTT